MKNQCKCGSLDFFIEKQGNNTGLYCSMCGKWQKWMNRDEIRLFEHNHKPKKKSKINQTNADRIRAMSDEELAEFLTVLNEHCLAGIGKIDCSSCDGYCEDNCRRMTRKWLQSEAEYQKQNLKGSD